MVPCESNLGFYQLLRSTELLPHLNYRLQSLIEVSQLTSSLTNYLYLLASTLLGLLINSKSHLTVQHESQNPPQSRDIILVPLIKLIPAFSAKTVTPIDIIQLAESY